MSDKLAQEPKFGDIIHIIETARQTAFAKVNEELIRLYWRVGEYLSAEMEKVSYGDGYIQGVADFIASEYPDIRGFNKRGLYRMKQSYETYKDNEIVSPLLTQLSWTSLWNNSNIKEAFLMIKAGILGVTGYAGIELLRLLISHPEVEVCVLVSGSNVGIKISDLYPHLKNICDLTLEELDYKKISEKCDIVFTSLPHGASDEVIPSLYNEGLKIIDLSGDYRYDDAEVYEKWYNTEHKNKDLLKKSVYGLCELYRDDIKKTNIVGNPGCYTTTSILGAAPLIKGGYVSTENIIVDAKSGVSGAGRGIHIDYHYCECTENTKAYKIATHRHTSEIEQEYSKLCGKEVMISFTPHLVPMKRGIYATIYMNLTDNYSDETLIKAYKDFYKDCPFIRIYEKGKIPESNHTAGSNYVDIGLMVDKRLKRVIITATLDNLIKGAAGQAVQNLNIMYNLDETTGLGNCGQYL